MPKDAGGENRGHGGRLKDGAAGMEGERRGGQGEGGKRGEGQWGRARSSCAKGPPHPRTEVTGGCYNWDDLTEMAVLGLQSRRKLCHWYEEIMLLDS